MKFFIISLLFILQIYANAYCQWIENGLPFLASENKESIERLIPDYEGNVYVIWFSIDAGSKLWVSKIDTGGYRMWDTDSVMVSLYPSQQRSFDSEPDGEGGFVIAWRDTRTDPGAGDIYAQRMDKDGKRLWGDDAVPVMIEDHTQDNVEMCRLNDGTYIVICNDERAGFNKDQIFGQRISRNGDILWDTTGISITNYPEGRNGYQKIIRSDSNNCIMVWNETQDDWNIYAQKLNEYGEKLWDSTGVAIANLSCSQGEYGNFDICDDGAGGVVAAWEDGRDGVDIYIQRVDSTGTCLWQDNGILQPNSSIHPTIVPADSGYYMLFWGHGPQFVQKITETGEFLFPANGLPISNDGDWGAVYQETTLSGDGIIIAWERGYSEEGTDIYTQKIDFNGNKLWGDKDIAICTSPQDQFNLVIDSDKEGGAYIAWFDYRDMASGNLWDAYMQRVYADGRVGGVNAIEKENYISIIKNPLLHQNYPNPFNSATTIRFKLPKAAKTSLIIYDIQSKEIIRLINRQLMKGGGHQITWNGLNRNGEKVSSGIYFYRLRTADMQITKKLILMQ